jgi:hypothetical protein
MVGSGATTCHMAPALTLLAEVGLGAAMCPMAPDLDSRIR